jgi:hypothetical protein
MYRIVKARDLMMRITGIKLTKRLMSLVIEADMRSLGYYRRVIKFVKWLHSILLSDSANRPPGTTASLVMDFKAALYQLSRLQRATPLA